MHHQQFGVITTLPGSLAPAGTGTATSTAGGGGFWSSVIGGLQTITQPAVAGGRSILDSISASYLTYRGTRDAQKENLERARQGLPPIEATPLPATPPPPPPDPPAAPGLGIDNTTLLIGGGVLLAVVLLAARK
jgi:hypothetical protein